jgi:uncharacterized peroxidase-related enzyme
VTTASVAAEPDGRIAMTSEGPWVTTVPWAAATGTLKDAYDWQAERLGEPTEFTMLGSLYPELVMERLRLYKVVEGCQSNLDPVERLLAALVTSARNDTPHCSSGLRARLADAGVAAELVDLVAAWPERGSTGSARLDAVVAYAAKLTSSPAAMDPADAERLREVGLDDLDLIDLNNMVAYFNYVNRVANGLGLRTEIPLGHALHAAPR